MIVNCKECNKCFNKRDSQIKKSKSGNHFCSSSCSAIYNNKFRKKESYSFCLNCKAKLNPKYKSRIYCSNSCQQKYRQENNFKLLEAGENITSHTCSVYHRKKQDRCSCCKLSKWNNKPISLELDHIDGDGTNNTLINTRLLCPNCHSQTDTYKGRNHKNPLGKKYRQKRYHKRLK